MKFNLLMQKLKEGDKYIRFQKTLENNTTKFTHYPPLWRLYNTKLKSINFNWQQLYFSSGALPNVPVKTSGIYLFVLKPPVSDNIFPEYNHIMYVGMTSDGLIERLKTGYRTPSAVSKRPHVHRMIMDYGKYLWWYYTPLPTLNKQQIEEIETFLIGYFCDPPINRKDQPVLIRNARKSRLS